ncbi:NifU family protein [Hyphomonas sp.]|uniref:NifU family protein n=1 Tax=Hyphomonas sp. TaxID=87 RepID=UPI00391A4A39
MFIQTEATPNPDTVKFLPGPPVAGALGSFDYPDAASARQSLLARALFQVEGVDRVFLGSDFVSVSKDPSRDWRQMKPLVLAAIMDHYMAGLPVVEAEAGADAGEAEYEGETAEIVNEIKELIETRVRPAVAQDGGDITFQRFDADTGIVHLSLRGACAGCPSSTMTLKQGIENMLRTYVPEVTAVEAAL